MDIASDSPEDCGGVRYSCPASEIGHDIDTGAGGGPLRLDQVRFVGGRRPSDPARDDPLRRRTLCPHDAVEFLLSDSSPIPDKLEAVPLGRVVRGRYHHRRLPALPALTEEGGSRHDTVIDYV